MCLLRTTAALLICGTLGICSATKPQESQEQHQHHRRHHKSHHNHHNVEKEDLVTPAGADQLEEHPLQQASIGSDGAAKEFAIAAKGSIEHSHKLSRYMRQEAGLESMSDEEGHEARSLLSTGNNPQAGEITVSCGKHNAPDCSSCSLNHGKDWCHGDCMWSDLNSTCVKTPPAPPPKAGDAQAVQPYPTRDERMSDDAIAAKLRAEQEREEREEREAKEKFWAIVGISAGASSLCIICCGMIAICFCLRDRQAKGAEPLVDEAEAEGEAEGEDVGEEADSGEQQAPTYQP
jgi:hypothetical protein